METTESFVSNVRLNFVTAEPQSVVSELSKSASFFHFTNCVEIHGYIVNLNLCGQEERKLVDAGELLPSIAYYWLKLSVTIMEYCSRHQQISVLCIPDRRIISPLSIADVCHEIYSGAWMSGAQVAIVWGVSDKSLRRADFPIKCSGAVFPIIEGMGIGWKAPSSESSDIQQLLNT